MPPKKQNQPTGKAPILQMDSATFQATVTAAVAAALAVLNANNTNVGGSVNGNPNLGVNQSQQQVPTRKDTPNLLKRKFKGSCSTQRPTERQRFGTVSTQSSLLFPHQPYPTVEISRTAANATTIIMESAECCIALDAIGRDTPPVVVEP